MNGPLQYMRRNVIFVANEEIENDFTARIANEYDNTVAPFIV